MNKTEFILPTTQPDHSEQERILSDELDAAAKARELVERAYGAPEESQAHIETANSLGQSALTEVQNSMRQKSNVEVKRATPSDIGRFGTHIVSLRQREIEENNAQSTT